MTSSDLYLSGLWRQRPFIFDNWFFIWYAMEKFKRPKIKQHTEVIKDGFFKPKTIIKTKQSILEKELLREINRELLETETNKNND